MAKLFWKPGTLLYPVPVVLVSCGDIQGVKNIITIAWAGTVASDPVMVSISVRPERYSYKLIKDSGEFVINLPKRSMVRAVDFCGVVSGKDCDKFQATGLTAVAAKNVKAPLIDEAPLALECKVSSMNDLGSHHLFLAKVIGVQVEETLIDRNGRLNLAKADLISYVHGQYWTLKEAVGNFGFSVKKRMKKE
ncbi:MAG TPA: flavin reductase family protein [Firmicutes bacterium]|jgi:flavin reductase (DIM6/NTAB) family NADH-FMN oxidoreductase RutF|nr:flavin reductase family protein [Bacillota bacterium]